MKIPTREELVENDSLDDRHVVKWFLGKTQDEAYAMLLDKPGYFTEDLTYMAAGGLAYYLPVFEKYAQDEKSRLDSYFVGGALTALSSRIKYGSVLPPEVLQAVQRFAVYLRENHAKYDMELDDPFYGARWREIEEA